MVAHAPLAPSSASRRKVCAGSRRMEALYPETEESPSSAEGTAAHWAASEILSGRTVDEGLIAENGTMLTDEMIDAAWMYVDEIRKVTLEPIVETRVSCANIHEQCWGTPDAWHYDDTKGIVYIWDFKYGHRYVDVFENWQLIEYAEGILTQLGVNGITDHNITVQMTIVQPRCYLAGKPVRSWTLKAVDLRGYFNQARLFEAQAMADDAPTTVSPECRDCSARHACTALQRASYAAMDVASTSIPFDLPPHPLGVELRYVKDAIEKLEARASGLEQQALNMIKRGTIIPFFTAQHGMGRQKWNKPEAEVIAMGELLGVKLHTNKLISPKQAVKAGMNETLVQNYTESLRGELKLVPDDNINARKIFGSTS